MTRLLLYVSAVAAHAVLFGVFVLSVLWFMGSPVFAAVVLVVGLMLIAFSAWQSIRGVRAGEGFGDALCWLMD